MGGNGEMGGRKQGNQGMERQNDRREGRDGRK